MRCLHICRVGRRRLSADHLTRCRRLQQISACSICWLCFVPRCTLARCMCVLCPHVARAENTAHLAFGGPKSAGMLPYVRRRLSARSAGSGSCDRWTVGGMNAASGFSASVYIAKLACSAHAMARVSCIRSACNCKLIRLRLHVDLQYKKERLPSRGWLTS